MIFSAPASRRRAARAAVRMPPPTRTRIGARSAKLPYQASVASASHGGVEIDDVEQRVIAEAVEQAEDVVDREAPLAAVHQLHGAAVLQIDARNDHRCSLPAVRSVRRTGTPLRAEEALQVAKALYGVVENRRRQRRIGTALDEYVEKIRGRVGAAGGDHRHGHRVGNRGGQRADRSRCACRRDPSRSAGSRPRRTHAPSCAHATASRPVGFAAAAHEGLPVIADALGVDRQNDGLRTEFGGELGQQFRAPQRRRIHRELVGAGAQNRRGLRRPWPRRRRRSAESPARAATRRIVSRNVGPMVARGGNVQHHQLIRAFSRCSGPPAPRDRRRRAS